MLRVLLLLPDLQHLRRRRRRSLLVVRRLVVLLLLYCGRGQLLGGELLGGGSSRGGHRGRGQPLLQLLMAVLPWIVLLM